MRKVLMFSGIRSWIVSDIGIDMRSASPRVCVKGSGTMFEVPSALAINTATRRVVDAGEKVERHLGLRAGKVVVVSPSELERVEDVEIVEAFLRFCIEKVSPRQWWRKLIKPRLMVVVRKEVTGVWKCAIEVAARKAGASDVYFAEGAKAAEIEPGLPIMESPHQLPTLGWKIFAPAIVAVVFSIVHGWLAWAIVAAIAIGAGVIRWIWRKIAQSCLIV